MYMFLSNVFIVTLIAWLTFVYFIACHIHAGYNETESSNKEDKTTTNIRTYSQPQQSAAIEDNDSKKTEDQCKKLTTCIYHSSWAFIYCLCVCVFFIFVMQYIQEQAIKTRHIFNLETITLPLPPFTLEVSVIALLSFYFQFQGCYLWFSVIINTVCVVFVCVCVD